MSETAETISGSILLEAKGIVAGPRAATHGSAERSFEAIAGLWQSYLDSRKAGGPLGSRDVAWMMVLLKITRSMHGSPARDHFVDAVGYAALAAECGDMP